MLNIIGINTFYRYQGIGKYSADLNKIIPVYSLVLDKRYKDAEYPGKKILLPYFIGNGYEVNLRLFSHYVKKIIKETNADMIHFTNPRVVFKDSDNIVTFHDLYGLYSNNEKERKREYKVVMSFIDYNIISITQLLKDELIDLGFDKNKITVIPLSVDNTIFKNLKNENKDYVLTVGDGSHKNNYDVCKILNKAGIKHIHVGREVDLNHYGNKELITNVNDIQLNDLYNNAIATVRFSSMEGFGVPVLESLFAGTPIILKKLPVFEEILGKEYPLFLDKLEDIVEMVKFALNERESILDYFSKISQKYMIENWVNNMIKYYKKFT